MTISLIASESEGKGLRYTPFENVQAVRGTTLMKRGCSGRAGRARTAGRYEC